MTSAAAAPPLIRATGLAGQRGERLLFSALTIDVRSGDIVWLRGRNGCGKTTLLRLLAGLSSPSAGTVERGGAGHLYIAHANALKDDLSAAEALAFLASLHGPHPTAGALSQALQQLGVAPCARRPVRTLSQGQRRRVALARLALPDTPPLWLLDEPFDALDDDGISALNTLLATHAARGGAALLTSHQPLSLRNPLPRVLALDASDADDRAAAVAA